MEFNVGDRVIMERPDLSDEAENLVVGSTGTVVDADNHPYGVGVYWDDYSADMHNLDGLCEQGHGWWTNPDSLEHLDCIPETAAVSSEELFEFLGI